MFDNIRIKSHKGEYTVSAIRSGIDLLNEQPVENAIYIIDKRIVELYEPRLKRILNTGRVLQIESKEENKSLERFPEYVEVLVELKVRRTQPLVAIGGGVIQDIACFLATTLMRGLPWIFYPTTLLAQSDSCIGSKSSINSGEIKNILGTFTPPNSVVIDVDFLGTLEKKDIFSGIGEMIKVHAIDSPGSFDHIASQYDQILTDNNVMERFICDSLLMKKKWIELDEFDQGPRNIMNYGHSFGHAIESATRYAIPHGIAVTIGMDLANFVASQLGISDADQFERMHPVLEKNCKSFRHINIDMKLLMNALIKDKKNTHNQLKLIMPDLKGVITVGLYDNDSKLTVAIEKYFALYGAK